jgi:uridine kinase
MWRGTVIEAHHKYVEPGKFYSDFSLFWGGLKHNMIAVEGVAGAIEYKFTEKNKK